MSQSQITLPALWRYQARLLLGNLRPPQYLTALSAASVCMALATMLTINTGADASYTAETLAPLLAAFLTAFCLAPERQVNALDLVAHRPGFSARVVLPRALAIMAASLGAIGLTLSVLSVFLEGTKVPIALAVAFPSVWALSLLSLTFATRFRSPLAGFGLAACIWALNAAFGYGINPLLCLQGYFAAVEREPFKQFWLLGKLALLVLGAILLAVHRRHSVVAGRAKPDLLRTAAAGMLVLGLYVASGAALVVTLVLIDQPFGDSHLAWLQNRMSPLRATGIPRLFGPAFEAYIAGETSDRLTRMETAERIRQLEQAAARWPKSIWADRMTLEAGQLQALIDSSDAIPTFLRLADRSPRSYMALQALQRILWLENQKRRFSNDQDRVIQGSAAGYTAARRILADHPDSYSTRDAHRYIESHFE